MAARPIIVPGAMPSRDRNGRVLPAKLRFYEQGTAFSVPGVIYTDSSLTVTHEFPILSDAAGRWPAMWADEDEVFDVAWSDQGTDRPLGQWTDLSPADSATLGSVELAQAAQEAAEDARDDAEGWALQAQAAAATVSGAPFQATSSSSLALTVGAKTINLNQTGKLFAGGQSVVIARAAPNASTQMVALIEDVGGTALDVTVGSVTGTPGTYSDWEISLTTAGGVQSLGGATGILSAAAARTAIDTYSTAEAKGLAIAFAVSL
ncbi:MAG: hypothetical protein JHD15_07100 [Phenylobacterium sp.]|uniref:hypothetical protein n=1 Tax=Phenylobacterium sp. TaxID=1871053 RepID=UPI001A30D7B4|nr:hypothetical protein [Phenylobacterium sp.]MBJ7410120.1 hypothetical protein [Phenylobacterium sp.]